MTAPINGADAEDRLPNPGEDTTVNPTVLITAFEAFGGLEYNPSADVAQTLAQRWGAQNLVAQREGNRFSLETMLLPVEFDAAAEALAQRCEQVRPQVVICLGLAGGTHQVRFERVGINLRDARIPDNAGKQPVDTAVVGDGPGALFTTLRVKAAAQRATTANLPVALSLSAGSYVCNDLLYLSLHHASQQAQPYRTGFVHVPDLRDPASGVTLEDAVAAVDILLAASLEPGDDDAQALGALH